MSKVLVDEHGNRVPGRYSALDWAREITTGKGTSTKATLLAIVLRVDDSLTCYPSWDLIGSDIEASATTVWRGVKNLRALSCLYSLQTKSKKGQSSNLYVVNVNGWLNDLDHDIERIFNRVEFVRDQLNLDLAPRGRQFKR